MTRGPSPEASTALVVALLALYAALGALGVRHLWTALPAAWRSPHRQRRLLEAAALFLPALGLRLFLAPCAPYHGEGTEYATLDAACRPFLDQVAWPYYGGAAPVLYGLAVRALPWAERTVFALNAVLGSLSVLLVRDVTRRLVGSGTAAVAAAILYAILPSQVRLACSESLMNPLVFQWLLALALALRLGTASRWPAWALVAALAMAATNTRPCGLLILPMLALATWPVLAARPVRLLWALPMLVGVVPVWVALGGELGGGGFTGSRLANLLGTGVLTDPGRNPWWLPQLTPWLLHPLAQAAGVAWLFARRQWRAAVLPTFAIVASELLVLSQAVALLIALRFTAPAAPFVALLGGVVVAALCSMVRARVRVPEAVVAGVLLVASSAPHVVDHVRLVTFEGNLQAEYRFLEEALPLLPDRSLVVTGSGWQRDTHYMPTFPTCMAARFGRTVRHADAGWIDRLDIERTRHPGGLYAFIGLYCYSFSWDSERTSRVEHPPPLDADTPLDVLLESYVHRQWLHRTADGRQIAACEELRARYEWTPLLERTVTSRPEQWFSVPSREVTFGLYRLDRESP